jgi:hypothetical protein
MTRKQTDRLIFYGSVTHVRGHTIIQPECGKTRNLEIVFNALPGQTSSVNFMEKAITDVVCPS